METNYIRRLQNENKNLKARIDAILAEVKDTEVYYSSAKFQGHDNDYAYVRTDVLPRLRAIKALTWMSDDEIATLPGLAAHDDFYPTNKQRQMDNYGDTEGRIYRGELEATDADGVTTMADLA